MPRLQRRIRNQILFREVNDRIAELAATLDSPERSQSFICECARVGCREMLHVPLGIYAIVRDDDELYIVLPGHEDRTHEQTVTDHDGFVIVRTLRGTPTHAGSTALRQTE